MKLRIVTASALVLATALLGAPGAVAAPAAKAAKATITAAKTQVLSGSYSGTVKTLQTKSGLPIYIFKRDKKGGPSTCYGQCAVEWPPVLVKDTPTAGKGVRNRYLGTVRRTDGRLQVTYRGRPLYTWFGDVSGKAFCHDVDEFGGLWLVVRPDGSAVGRG